MNSFKLTEGYGSYCNECGKNLPGKPCNIIEVNGVSYTLCENCLKLMIGAIYMAKPQVIEELISTLAKKDRNRILTLING